MKIVLLLALMLGQAQARGPWRTMRRVAEVVFVAASTADLETSRGLYETNPVLGRGPFGARQVGIKLGIAGGVVLGSELLGRKHKDRLDRTMTVDLLAASAVLGVFAAHNARQ